MILSHPRSCLTKLTPVLLYGACLFAEGDPRAVVRECMASLADPAQGMLSARRCIEDVRKAGIPTLPILLKELNKSDVLQIRLRIMTVMHGVIEAAADQLPTKKFSMDKDIFKALAELVQDPKESFVTKYWIAKSFRYVDNEGMVPALATMLDEEDVKETLQVAAIMSIGTDRRGDDVLVKFARNSNPKLREAVCDALKGAISKKILGVYFRALVDSNALVRAAGIEGVNVHVDGDPLGYNPLADPDALQSHGPITKWYEWIHNVRRLKWAAEDQTPFFRNPVPEVRLKVVKSLAGSEAPEVLYTLFEGLLDKDEYVREEAMKILDLIETAPAKYDTNDDRKSRLESEKKWCNYIIKKVNQWDWVPLATTGTNEVKIVICRTFAGVKEKRIARFLYYMLLDADEEVREAAIDGLNTYLGPKKKFPFNPKGTKEERNAALGAVFKWLDENRKDFADP